MGRPNITEMASQTVVREPTKGSQRPHLEVPFKKLASEERQEVGHPDFPSLSQDRV